MRRATGSSGGSDHRRELALRVVAAAVLIPAVLLVNARGGVLFGAAIGVAAVIGAVEFYRLIRTYGARPATALGIIAAVAVAVTPLATTTPQAAWIFLLMALFVVSGLWFLVPGATNLLVGWLATVMGAVYIGLFLGHLSLLRVIHDGAWWVFVTLLSTWAYDSGAYFVGSYFGRHPFMSHISPSKTMEGLAGGLAVSALAGLVAAPTIGLSLWEALGLGLLVGAGAQVGDLVESMIKRQVGVKDSGALIPGHGGLLDRIDGLLFAAVVSYYAAVFMGYGA